MRLTDLKFELQEGASPLTLYCPQHGKQLTAKPEKGYDVHTGERKVQGYFYECPKLFCSHWTRRIVFIAPPAPPPPPPLEPGAPLDYRAEVLRNCPKFNVDPFEKKLDLGGLGVAGEGGEVADIVKKVLHHGVAFESVREKLIKEMGDVHWYLEFLAAVLGITTEQVLRANVAKLRARHPKGWSPESQQAKADERVPEVR